MLPLLSRVACLIAVALPLHCVADETLCKPKETIYFSCKVEPTGRLISLCGNSFRDPERFWLQYRFGRTDQIELEYPKTGILFSHSGFDVGYIRRANGFDIEVNFTSGGWSYTVFHWVPGEAENTPKSGVLVGRTRAGSGTTFSCAKNPNFGRRGEFRDFAQNFGTN